MPEDKSLEVINSDAPADARAWTFRLDGHILELRVWNDAHTVCDDLVVDRTGNRITGIRVNGQVMIYASGETDGT